MAPSTAPIMTFLLLMVVNPVHVSSISFNFTRFQIGDENITYLGDAGPGGGVIELTTNRRNQNATNSLGRAFYNRPVQLWDPATGRLTDFQTRFSFRIQAIDQMFSGDGLAFFLAADGTDVPFGSGGGQLGLFNNTVVNGSTVVVDFNNTAVNGSKVAVEFDTFRNAFDPSSDHVGIDVNSIVSVENVTWSSSLKDGRVANAWVMYNATSMNLSVYLTYAQNPTLNTSSTLYHIVNLTRVLPPLVYVGFSAATGSGVEIHNVLSWEFNSNLELVDPPPPSPDNNSIVIVGVVAGVVGFIGLVGTLLVILWRRKRSHGAREEGVDHDDDQGDYAMDDEFEKGTGPRRFTYKELESATNNFSESGKLGEGGFGGVYRGFLRDLNADVAVKRVSRSSKQGKKEYASEVKIISRLRHRSLVQLIGWCHERAEFLLVYEFMPNGSLDSHLFGGRNLVPWETRYKIAIGLASALLYLHEEWEQCVVHRDIKSSNVLLDSGFNAKLGDFGLARLVDHELGSQTTVLAGTMGYMAPECVTTGKASRESDVYSFGVVALEIACGRKPVEPREEPAKIRMVEWVWDLHGKGSVFEAIDGRLGLDYDEKQVERLMVVGLWCAHPDYNERPSMRQVISVLNFEAQLPSLPVKMPVPMYFPPPPALPLNFTHSSSTASSGLTRSEGEQSRQTSSSVSTTNSSLSLNSSQTTSLLKSHPR